MNTTSGMAPFWKSVPESHFSTEYLLKYLLPKIVTVTVVELSGQKEFNYSKKV